MRGKCTEYIPTRIQAEGVSSVRAHMADDFFVHGLEGEKGGEAGDVADGGEGFVGHIEDMAEDGGVIGKGEGGPGVAVSY